MRLHDACARATRFSQSVERQRRGWKHWAARVGVDRFPRDEERLVANAYSTFCRTLRGLSQIPRQRYDRVRLESVLILRSAFTELSRVEAEQIAFDEWHRGACDLLRRGWKPIFPLTIGQAQKWLNILAKYHAALAADGTAPHVRNIYGGYLHVPIDNIVLDELRAADRVPLASARTVREALLAARLPAWSRIDSWEQYLDLQSIFRELAATHRTSPIAIELHIWE